jgi:sugar lactone lactonase YvrE
MRYRNVVVLVVFALAGRAAESSAGADAGLRQAFERARFALRDNGHGTFLGENPAQRLTLEFDGREARLSHPDGSVSFRLTGYGHGERMQQPAQGVPTGAGNRVEYQRGDLTEWYVNGSQGLEQGFTLARRPGTDGDGQPLAIALGVSGELRPAQAADGAVRFGGVLRYAGLRAVDARGRIMPSRMAARDGEVRLIVEDRDAEYPLVVDPAWTQEQKLTASDGVASDSFGDPVSLDGDTAAIMAGGKNGARGAVYVFVRSGGVWTQQAELAPADAIPYNGFGMSMSLSKDTVVVGAWGNNGTQGAVYVFVRSGGVWTQQQKFTGSDSVTGDFFGYCVSVSGDTAVIGANSKNGHQGAAYVFVRSGGVWTQQQELTASDGVANDYFGAAVAVSGDTAAVGAWSKNGMQGAAYVFVRSGGVWTQQQKLTASNGVYGDYFGSAVSVSGDTAAIGANLANGVHGAAYVFVRSGGVWTQQQELTASDGAAYDEYGDPTVVSGDTLLIGAHNKNSGQGAAYVYVRSGGVWSLQEEVTASDGAAGQDFADSVSLSGDTALISAVGTVGSQGAAYVYVRPRLGTNSLLVGSAAGTSSVALACEGAWTAASNSTFLHVAPASASGASSGVVVFTYDAFPGTGWRTGTLTIAGQTATVTQAGANYVGPGPAITVVSYLGVDQPSGVAVDGSGNLYIADTTNDAIKEWSAATQQLSTLVSGLWVPLGVAVDGSGNVYFSEGANSVKEWSPATGQVTFLGTLEFSPVGVAVDWFGNVFFSIALSDAIDEWSAATQQVIPLVASGVTNADGVAVDVFGNVYLADQNNSAIKEWSAATGQVTPLVSSGLKNPTGVAVDGSGNVYIADELDNAIKQWSAATGQVTTLASMGMNYPYGVAVDGSGNVYVAVQNGSAIQEIPNAFVGPASLTEPAAAGSDSLLPVIPTTTNLTGVFAPVSDQTWLTIGNIANGVVGFSFTANTTGAPRTAHIALLGHQIPVTQNGVTNGTVSLAMGIGNGPPGQTAQAPILLASAGTDAPTAFQVDLSFDPTKLAFTSASAGAQLTSAGKSLSANTLANGDVRLLAAGLNQTPIPNGLVSDVTFALNPAFSTGSTTVTLKNCAASDSLGNILSTVCAAGTIVAFTCDLNGDGSVNVADVQLIINEALGAIPPIHDLNHDGVVNVADVQIVINAALGMGCPY